MAKKIIAQRSPLFSPGNTVQPQLSPFCHFTSVFFLQPREEKTAQHEDRREERAVEEAGPLRYDPAYQSGDGRGGGARRL